MSKPRLHEGFSLKPEAIPFAPVYEAGFLTRKNGAWRSERPALVPERCNGCLLCALCCPDGAVKATADGKVEFDEDFCKGCGLCARACRRGALTMEKEPCHG
ncbi:MAG: 4Fe-4S binding protein [Succinivibrio sp.]|jgi:2-oxoacid:acceptor oxidoreductase delta subunit (pyruvate/2-ketoisovalerate family)|nr:4Fe-4S binding protein [Succinivibrio sp.]